MNKLHAIVSAESVLAVLPCVSTEETRYYLCGIFLHAHDGESGGAVAVATDGHAMAMRHDRSGRCDRSVILTISKATASALRAKSHLRGNCLQATMSGPVEGEPSWKATASMRVLGCSAATALDLIRNERAGELESIVTHVHPGNAEIDGTFPNYRNFIPAMPETPVALGAFNPALLVRFARTYDGTCRAGGGCVRLLTGDAEGPALAFNGDPDFLGIAMPRRDGEPAMPAFLAELPVEAPKPAAEEPAAEAIAA